MKQSATFFIAILFALGILKGDVFSQASTANYTFASVTNGSLTDMSSGTTQLIAGNVTDGLSALQNIGFDFYYMGIKYSQFGVSSNGVFRFGALPSATSVNTLTSTAAAMQNILAPFWDALQTNSAGEVRYKVSGSEPDRILTVEWFNMEITAASSTADATFQLRLYETTGKIEFVYGSMNIGAGSGTVTASIGFKRAQSNNNVLSVTNIITPAVTTTAASVNNSLVNSNAAGPIAGLNSSGEGSRVVYSFTPPPSPNAPTNLSFTSVNNVSMTLNWTDNAANELNFIVERSTDGGSTYTAIASPAANSTSYNATGLNPGVTYFWKIYAIREGSASPSLSGSQATTSIAPNPPVNLTFTNISYGSMTLNWADDSSDEINFLIQKSTDGGSTYSDLIILAANSVSYTANDLSFSTSYFWRVYAIGGGNILSTALQGSQSTIAGAISGLKTIGETGNYPSIQDAFTAINSQGIGGTVILELQADYNSIFDPPSISCYGNTSGSSSSASVILRPATGVTGIVFTSSTVNFNFNGTKNLLIDGRPGGTGTAQEITIVNTGTSGNAVRFTNDASNNTVKYCKITGVNNSSSSGVVVQSTTTGLTGNDNNTIDNCEIRDGASAPAILIYNAGTAGKNNDGLTLSNCRLFNFTRAGFETSATGTGSNYTITGNSFYQSSSVPASVTSSATFIGIMLLGGGSNHLISGNYIGGQEANCGGSAYLITSAEAQFTGISIVDSNYVSPLIQNNFIQNINITGTDASDFYGIRIQRGSATIMGNTIGDNLISNSIVSAGTDYVRGILIPGNSRSTINCSNNLFANITASNSAINIGIDVTGNAASTTDTLILLNNILHDISGTRTVIGISGGGYFERSTINSNILYSLRTLSTLSSNVSAINSISVSSIISKNRIYDLTNTSAGNIYGINTLQVGSFLPDAVITNNQILIQNGANTNDVSVTGIASKIGKIYYNSVYIGGTISSGTKTSSCIYKDTNTVALSAGFDIRNNILYNERTGGTGNHYVLDYTNNNASITSDYNLFIGAASTIARWGTTVYNFADYKTTSSKDGNSFSNQPVSIAAASLFNDISVGNLNINASNDVAFYCSGKGIPITGQADDFGSTNVRHTDITQGVTDIGSDEFDYLGTIPNLTESGPPALNTTTTYSFGGRQIGSITWGNTGTVPTGLTFAYNPGVIPPGTLTGQYSNGYWEVAATGGSGYTYDITFNYTPSILYNIITEDSIHLAKRDGGAWDYLPNSTVNTTNKTVTATGLTSFSQFALTSSEAKLPVELASFNSLSIKNEVVLNWSTVTEINNRGFDIERKLANSNDWKKITFVQGAGNSNQAQNYKFNDKNLQTGNYNYRLKQIDYNGNYEYFNLSNEVQVGIPGKYDLSQNYPNPFNPATKINYELPKDGLVILRIYDLTGRQITELVNRQQLAGYYTINFNASSLSSGVYFYSIKANDFVSTKRMVLVK